MTTKSEPPTPTVRVTDEFVSMWMPDSPPLLRRTFRAAVEALIADAEQEAVEAHRKEQLRIYRASEGFNPKGVR